MITALMTDGQLDAAYEQAVISRNAALSGELATAIVDRMTSLTGFAGSAMGVTSVFGFNLGSSFPNYTRRTKFNPMVEAKSSINQAATNAKNKVFDFAKPALFLGGGLLLLYLVVKFKK